MTAADRDTLRIFAGSGGKELAESMAQHLNLRVSSGSADRFPDGEVIVRVQEDVRGETALSSNPPASRSTIDWWNCLSGSTACVVRAPAASPR